MTLTSPGSFTDKSYIALLSFEEDRGFFLHISYGSHAIEPEKAQDIQQLVMGCTLSGEERWQLSASGHSECLLRSDEAGTLYARLLRLLPGALETDEGVPVQAYWDKHAAAVLAGSADSAATLYAGDSAYYGHEEAAFMADVQDASPVQEDVSTHTHFRSSPAIPYEDDTMATADLHTEARWILEGRLEERSGVGQTMAVPMIEIGGVRYPAVELSRRMGSAGHYIRLEDGSHIETDLLREMGLGPMGRMADGTPLERNSRLTPQEIIQRGSERLRGPWEEMIIPGLALPDHGGLYNHFEFLCRWGISGAMLGGVIAQAETLGEFLAERIRQFPSCQIALIGRKALLTELRKRWSSMLEPYWQEAKTGKASAKSTPDSEHSLIAVPVSLLGQRSPVLPGGVDIAIYLEPDEMTADVSSKMYRAMNKISARIRLSIFTENERLEDPHLRTAQTSLLKLFHSVVREYAMADPEHPLTQLPPPYTMTVRRAAQPGLPQMARTGGFAEVELGTMERGMRIPPRSQRMDGSTREERVRMEEEQQENSMFLSQSLYELDEPSDSNEQSSVAIPHAKPAFDHQSKSERMEGLLQELSRQGIHIQRPPAFVQPQDNETKKEKVTEQHPAEYTPHTAYGGAELEMSKTEESSRRLYVPPAETQNWTESWNAEASESSAKEWAKIAHPSPVSMDSDQDLIELDTNVNHVNNAHHFNIEDADKAIPAMHSDQSEPIATIHVQSHRTSYAIPAPDEPLPVINTNGAEQDEAILPQSQRPEDIESISLEPMFEAYPPRQPIATFEQHVAQEANRSMSAIQSAEHVFALRAQEMAEQTEEEAEFVPFMSYWPTYESMTWRQKRWYFYWRGEVRQERYPATDLSYIFLLCYEVINGAGWQEPLEGHHLLMNLWRNYRHRFGKLDRYLPPWIVDFSLVHGLNESLLELLLESPRHVPSELADLEWERLLAASPITVPMEILPSLLDYDLERSRFYVDEGREVMNEYIPKVLSAIDAFLDRQQGSRLLGLFRPPVYRESERYLFRSAVYDSTRYGRMCTVRRLPLSEHAPLREFLTGIVKLTENELRRHGNVNGRLRIQPPVEPEIARLIERYIRRAFTMPEEQVAPRRVEIDPTLLERLQADSAVVRDMLTLREEEKEAIRMEQQAEQAYADWATAVGQPASNVETNEVNVNSTAQDMRLPIESVNDHMIQAEVGQSAFALEESVTSERDEYDEYMYSEAEDLSVPGALHMSDGAEATELAMVMQGMELQHEHELQSQYEPSSEHISSSRLESQAPLNNPQQHSDAVQETGSVQASGSSIRLLDMSELEQEWQDCLQAMQPQHIELLAAMLEEANEHTLQAVATRYGTMAALLADEINDLAMDHIGDLLLDDGAVMEEYRSLLDAIIMR